jgi:hypothetical protein
VAEAIIQPVVAPTPIPEAAEVIQAFEPAMPLPSELPPVRHTDRPSQFRLQRQGARHRFGQALQWAGSSRAHTPLVALAICLVIVLGWYGLASRAKPVTKAASPAILEQIARLTSLPSGENPEVLTVSDASAISQPFMKDAVNGDVVLLFHQAGKAVVYRPSTKTLVAVGPLAARTLVDVATVGLYNGTATSGITSREEPLLTSKIPQLSVVIKEKAIRQDYPKTVVVDLSGKHSDKLQAVADYYRASIVKLPAGETAPQADILVIFGANAQ